MGIALFIKCIKIAIETTDGPFGFLAKFDRNLNIIRGRNSSGKSTIVHSILYALGMEELLGAQNSDALTYVLKDHVEFDQEKHGITRSMVIMELESNGKTITVTRKIKEAGVNPKLVEIQECAALTEGETAPILYRFLHDGGSAQIREGFYTYLEEFLGLKLPMVPHTNGKQVKLYLQYIFAAMAIEQKRGWTDYIANLPYFGVREARIKIVDFLVGTNVFEMDAKRARLDHESLMLNTSWQDVYRTITNDALKNSIKVQNLPRSPTVEFLSDGVTYHKTTLQGLVNLDQFKSNQIQALHKLTQDELKWKDALPAETLKIVEQETNNLQELSVAYESCLGELTLHRAARNANAFHQRQAEEELSKNKAAQKLIRYGASLKLETAKDVCPACYQNIGHSLTDLHESTPHMDIETNIAYLQSQIKMLERDTAGIEQSLKETTVVSEELAKRIITSKARLRALKADLTTNSVVSKANLRQQLQIEMSIEEISQFLQRNEELLERLVELSAQFSKNQEDRAALPKDHYSEDDLAKYELFAKIFRSNVSSFDYHSAPVNDIKFNVENLLPELAKIELREIYKKDFSEDKKASASSTSKTSSNIARESSASDFVRLIWSYIVTLYQTSAHFTVNGNHPGFILMDEPGQHSMATKSQLALLQKLSSEKNLQSIVAASFDDSEAAYREATHNVQFKLIHLGDKAIVPNGDTMLVGG
ncbi:AAA family ATPase [Pseudomonas sp. IPO3774]|uniref:AAA family ATPase n=1 Tax=Pseudomonas sp. IPO3774 TaxID=2738826 RepID=UPI0015A0094B|nr:AAA family ATPase [Pseudomonas sp. IPO3774]NWD65603.1 AAA family ATPase [Pseudomonas sp. IPO3774]